MGWFLAVLFAASLAEPLLTAPFNLRASGSNLAESGRDFALSGSKPLVFQWAAKHATPGASQTAYEVVIRNHRQHEIWRSGRVESSRPVCVYSGKQQLTAGLYEWQVRVWDHNGERSQDSAAARFHIAQEVWSQYMAWLGSATDNLYRAEYVVPEGADAVVAYVCGLGYSKVTINGQPVNDQVLLTAPWTNNERINGFSSFLVPNSPGRHAIGVALGHGWRNTSAFPNSDHDQGSDTIERVLRAQIFAIFSDNSTSILLHTGDAAWHSAAGPVTADSVYDGETYDARIAQKLAGWDIVGGGADWKPASVLQNPPLGHMVPWTAPAIKIDSVRKPMNITNPKPGIYVVDFGSNLAGVVRFKDLACSAGSNITIRHAEIMQHQGLPDLPNPDPTMIYVGNLRSARATDTYTCSGSGAETWRPEFTYHGFRFVEFNVNAAPGVKITVDNVEQLHFHSAIPQRAFVKFKSETLNKIQTLALGAQRSNFMSVPTDCDQRDERLGWMGDANLSGDSMLLNFDAAAFFMFFLETMDSELGTDGTLPDVVPFVRYGGRPGDVSWTGAYVNLASALWTIDETTTGLADRAPLLLQQLANVKAQAAQGLANMHTPYGDWCPPPVKIGGGQGPKPSPPFTSAFSYLNMIQQLHALAAGPLANATLAAELLQQAQSVAKDFNTAFYKGSGAYDSVKTQTALALALALQVSPDANATATLLIQDILAHSTHYTTGIIGFKALLPVLQSVGKGDLALALLQQTDYPSIGYNFANSMEPASENLWELPDALGEGTGMNSRNHHMWSSYSGYLVKQAAGLNPVAPGRLLLTPATNQLAGAEVLLRLPEGDASLQWQRTGGVQVDKVAEGFNLNLDCGKGVIESVLFASFGTPFMQGESMATSPDCHSKASREVVEALCVNRSSCVVPAAASLFGAACGHSTVEQPLKLWASVKCSTKPELMVQATIPLTSVGELRLSLPPGNEFILSHSNKPMSLSDLPLGVNSFELDMSSKTIVLILGSGSFEFNLSAQ